MTVLRVGGDAPALNCLTVAAIFDHGLDIEDRGAVNGFKIEHFDPACTRSAHFNAMQPDGIRAVRRSRGEDAGERVAQVRPRMNFECGAPGLVQPGEQP